MDGSIFSTNFASFDWVIVAVYLLATVLVGVITNRYIHSVSDYMVGGRGVGAALNTATYIGTGLGLVTLMYASIEAFSHGFAYVTLAVIGAVVGIFLGSTGFVIAKLRELKLLTVPEYFENRYNKPTRVLAGVICAVAGIMNMGLFPKMGATFITVATGVMATGESAGGIDATAFINIVTSVLIVLVLFYTILGGMVSVIVTDFLQFIVLSVGLGLGVYFCLTHQDLGWNNMVSALAEHRGEKAFSPVATGSYGWTWVGFNCLLFFGAFICWAPEASRALTAKDIKATKLTFLLSGPGQFVRLAIPSLFAIAAFCMVSGDALLAGYFFPKGLSAPAEHAGQAMPLLLGKIVPSGLLGLIVAGLIAAFMSTHDSYLLCWSSVITRDIVVPLRRDPLSDRAQIYLTRWVIVLIGAFLLVWGIWYPLPDSVWTYMGVTGTIYISGAMVSIIGGIYWRRASSAGAFAALLTGLVAILGLLGDIPTFKDSFPNWLTGPVVALCTYSTCAVVFVIVSLLFPDKHRIESRVDE